MEPEDRRYEISVLIGPCSQEKAEQEMLVLHKAADALGLGPGVALNYWDETAGGGSPGEPVPGVDVV